jgi:UDP-N-acetylmuramate--alanine ligase
VQGDLMSKTVDLSGKPFHFIGIGGIGMSALAYILAKRKLPVAGSDLRSTHITKRLEAVGAYVFNHQEASNLDFFSEVKTVTLEQRESGGLPPHASVGLPSSAMVAKRTAEGIALKRPQVICSTAISHTNSEYQAAKARDCPIYHRSDLLAALIREYESIAVAGTHGKTTTSSLIAYLLLQAGLDPTVIVGGEVSAWEGNARVGNSPYLVAEADESDGSLVKLSANIGIVTNIELDHPDHYQSLEEVVGIFHTFAGQCETLVGCIDCPTVREHLQPEITYSLDPLLHADYTAQEIHYSNRGTTAQVWERGTCLGTMTVGMLGEHNLKNALAAVAVGRKLGIEFATIAEAMATFQGAKRRFEYRGEANGIVLVDDYAHHPSEIRATLTAARLRVAQGETPTALKRVVAVFQPHRYSRTQAFLAEFAQAFGEADVVVVTDIYSAGESHNSTLNGEQVKSAIAQHHTQVEYHPTLSDLVTHLPQTLQPGDLVVCLGAGNLNQIIPDLLVALTK